MRGPAGRDIGRIRNVTLENITAEGPYEEYDVVPWNYASYKRGDTHQNPKIFGVAESFDAETVSADNAVQIVTDAAVIFLPLSDIIDTEKERARLTNEKTKLEGEADRIEKNGC